MDNSNDLHLIRNRIRSAIASISIDEDTEALADLVKCLEILDNYI